MGQLHSIIGFIEALLEPATYQDGAFNGLVVDGGNHDIRSIAYAVDSGLSIIESAVKNEADLLITHHSLLYGKDYYTVTGAHGKKIATLLRGHCSLYCAHLPLDGNMEVGNGAQLARFLRLSSIEPFCRHQGSTIGAKGQFDKRKDLNEIVETLKGLPGITTEPLVFPFGKAQVKTVGVVTGAGGFAMNEAASLGLDLLISGEPKQHEYHAAKELGINAIFAGHYATEVFGVKSLSELVAKQFGIRCIFIDEPTGV